ncbi:MAG: hypothetical protein ACE5DI_05430 [Candidatus Micrarchaeia archaeon]
MVSRGVLHVLFGMFIGFLVYSVALPFTAAQSSEMRPFLSISAVVAGVWFYFI